jgi:CyaY protein
MTTDSTFIASADAVLAAIGAALDAALAGDASESGNGTDWSLVDGILEIECGDGSKLIVNRHVPNREIWVAARSGGFHFRADGGAWRDARSGGELGLQLTALLRDQAGLAVELAALPPPPA